jgi:hypothetical protein
VKMILELLAFHRPFFTALNIRVVDGEIQRHSFLGPRSCFWNLQKVD